MPGNALSLSALQNLSDEEVVRRHDEQAKTTVVGILPVRTQQTLPKAPSGLDAPLYHVDCHGDACRDHKRHDGNQRGDRGVELVEKAAQM